MRATGDIDVLVSPDLPNAQRLERAVREFADASLEYFGVSLDELAHGRVGFFMGVEPDRIDIMTKIAGVRFERAWRGRLRTSIDGVDTSVLGFVELIAAKRAAIRKGDPSSPKSKQDEADLAWLLAERERRRNARS